MGNLRGWNASVEARKEALEAEKRFGVDAFAEQFLVIVTCRDERQQVELLGRFRGEGLECRAVVG
jgi:hypothetical protein